MCGIAGLIVQTPNQIISVSHLQQMTSLIRHRGPDDEGYALFNNGNEPPHRYGGTDTPGDVFASAYPFAPDEQISERDESKSFTVALAHRRLAVVDLTPAGHQPMSYDHQRYWITYNGEIYNWRELRSELESLGHAFVSHTDTEVILAAFSQWGKECLHRFNGMWAFVIFDTQTGTLFAARDRFGVKPLYYWRSPEGVLAFASEIKQFTVLPGWNPLVNGSRVFDYLVLALVDHTAETLFSGVYQIRGGQALELDIHVCPDTLPVYQWYELSPEPYSGTLQEAATAFHHLLKDSVRLRLRADVPVGSCLSGGLDSSSIVCLTHDILQQEDNTEIQKTFSACSDVERFDERQFIDEVVQTRSIDAHYTCPDSDHLLEVLDELIWYQDEPFGSTSIFAQWMVFELAAKNQETVMLDGQGADELLCGYHGMFEYRYADLFRQGRWITLSREIIEAGKIYGYSAGRSLVTTGYFLMPAAARRVIRGVLGKEQYAPAWLNREMLGIRQEPCFVDMPRNKSVDARSKAELFHTSVPGLLHWEDRNSMAHSVESRVPFLDYRLVGFLSGLPADYKLHNACTKVVLREGMKGVLPEKIRMRRDKLGFATAEEEWIRTQKTEEFRELVSTAIAQSQGILNEKTLDQFELIVSGKAAFSFLVWRWICLGRWMKTYHVGVQ
jgi:asparagine synthase (glutamine-hydrolysing)